MAFKQKNNKLVLQSNFALPPPLAIEWVFQSKSSLLSCNDCIVSYYEYLTISMQDAAWNFRGADWPFQAENISQQHWCWLIVTYYSDHSRWYSLSIRFCWWVKFIEYSDQYTGQSTMRRYSVSIEKFSCWLTSTIFDCRAPQSPNGRT